MRVVTVEIAVKADDERTAENHVLEILGRERFVDESVLHEWQVTGVSRSFSQDAKAFGARLWPRRP